MCVCVHVRGVHVCMCVCVGVCVWACECMYECVGVWRDGRAGLAFSTR